MQLSVLQGKFRCVACSLLPSTAAAEARLVCALERFTATHAQLIAAAESSFHAGQGQRTCHLWLIPTEHAGRCCSARSTGEAYDQGGERRWVRGEDSAACRPDGGADPTGALPPTLAAIKATTKEVEAAESYLTCPCAKHITCFEPQHVLPVPLPDTMPTQVPTPDCIATPTHLVPERPASIASKTAQMTRKLLTKAV